MLISGESRDTFRVKAQKAHRRMIFAGFFRTKEETGFPATPGGDAVSDVQTG